MPRFSASHYADYYDVIVPSDIEFRRGAVHPKRLEQLVFDLAATCNMGCSYCFADRGRYGAQDSVAPALLRPDIADQIIDKVLNNCSSVGHIKFFGGEPLLNYKTIKRICERLDEAVKHGRLDCMPTFNIVTNGTLFSKEIAKILRKYSIAMVVSIDGPKLVHDAQRKLLTGSGTFDRIVANVERYANEQCNLCLLEAVYSPLHVEHDYSLVSLYKYLENTFGEAFDFIALHPLDQETLNWMPDTGAKKKYISEMRIGARELYEYMILRDVQSKTNKELFSVLNDLRTGLRGENLCGIGYEAITVKSDGSVYSCYVFTGDEKFRYGSILSDDFWDQYSEGESSKIMDVASRFENEACKSCDVQRTCTHCLSGMDATKGLSPKLPDINCEFNIGKVEGFFSALEVLRRNGQFDGLCDALTVGYQH